MKNWPQNRCIVNGASLRYFRSGGPSSGGTKSPLPPLVLVHGYTDNALYFSRAATLLAEHWDVIAYDCRGHGESDRANGNFSDGQRVGDLIGLVEQLGLESPAMMGHSMGAATIALAIAHQPGLSRAIVLEDPAWWEYPTPPTVEEKVALDAGRMERNKAWHDWVVEMQHAPREEALALRRKDSPLWAEEDVQLSLDARLEFELDLFTYFPQHESPWRSLVPKIDCPALLVIGEDERGGIISVDTANEVSTLNAKFKWSKIDGAGHAIRYDQFDAFMAAVTAFLAPLCAE